MQQNFKISRPTSEYLRCASKCAISRLNNQKFPSPDPCPGREGTPLGASPPRRLNAAPSKLKSCLRHWLEWAVI